ncbi:MAG: HEAT repeat domain-containing protein [Gemmataceae bacterium]
MFVASVVVALGLLPGQKAVPLAVKQPVPPPPVLAQPIVVPLGIPVPPPAGFPMTAPGQPGPATATPGGPGDEAVLRAARIGPTDADLIAFFRQRTPPAPPREQLDALVRQLGAKEPADRDAAHARLVSIGLPSVPPLRQTANNVDAVELSARARECLGQIEGTAAAALAANAARLLAARKPAGAAEALLGYLPFAEDEPTFQELELALVALALRDGKPDPAILAALKDRLAIRRGTAAQVLCQATGSPHPAIRPLLKDPNPSVRLRAALGLVGAYDAEAIPVLIDLLADLTPRLRQQAEDHLIGLAGEWAVTGPRGNDLMARRLRRDVWAAWWKNTDGAMLLEEFRSRVVPDDERDRIAGLIGRLADPSSDVRDAAVNDLVALGKPAAAQLRRAVSENHPQISPLAARCLEGIEKEAPSPVPAAAPRLLALRRPEGTVEAAARLPAVLRVDRGERRHPRHPRRRRLPRWEGRSGAGQALDDRAAARRAGAVTVLCKGRRPNTCRRSASCSATPTRQCSFAPLRA